MSHWEGNGASGIQGCCSTPHIPQAAPQQTVQPIRSMQRLRNPMQTCHTIPRRGPLSAPQTQAMLSHSFLQGMLPTLPTLPAETAPALPSPEPPSLLCHICSSSFSLIQQACSEYAPQDRCHTSRWAFNSEQSHRSHSLRPYTTVGRWMTNRPTTKLTACCAHHFCRRNHGDHGQSD